MKTFSTRGVFIYDSKVVKCIRFWPRTEKGFHFANRLCCNFFPQLIFMFEQLLAIRKIIYFGKYRKYHTDLSLCSKVLLSIQTICSRECEWIIFRFPPVLSAVFWQKVKARHIFETIPKISLAGKYQHTF